MTETTGTETGKKGLSGSFKKGTTASINYSHPYATELLEESYTVLNECESGQLLLRMIDNNLVPINIIKGTGESGYSPELNAIYMQAPGKQNKANGVFILQFAKALHEAAQEYAGFKTPDPATDIMAYASFVHGRNLDSITEICRIVKELTKSSYFSDLLDSLTELGLSKVYKAFVDGASRDELYMEYAAAYDANYRGSN